MTRKPPLVAASGGFKEVTQDVSIHDGGESVDKSESTLP
jgi:hypothetical protein